MKPGQEKVIDERDGGNVQIVLQRCDSGPELYLLVRRDQRKPTARILLTKTDIAAMASTVEAEREGA